MILALCVLLAPQTFADDAWFRLHPAPRPAPEKRFVVSGTHRAAPAEEALRRLARLMDWDVHTPSEAVQRRLSAVTLDLAFSRQDPGVVAQLIGAAAGVEVTLIRVGRGVELQFVESSATPTKALRTRALDWYRALLADPTVTGVARVEALTEFGDALVDAGSDRAAIEVFQRVFEQDDSGRFVGTSLLAASRAYYRLAKRVDTPDLQRRSDLQLADQTARRLLQRNDRILHASASLLLGQILVTAGREQDCIELLEGQQANVGDAPQHTDTRLLLASSYLRAEQPERALTTLNSLSRPTGGERRWTRLQWQEYHFLRGTSAEVSSRRATARARAFHLVDAMRSLEWFLGTGWGTARRTRTALIALGRVYLANGKHLDARATVLRLLEDVHLDDEHLQDVRILEARTMTALGFGERARDRLELAVRANPTGMPKVVEFLRRDGGATHGGSLRELSPVASVSDASLADLFRVACRHEMLHLRARHDPATPPELAARHLGLALDLFDRIERHDIVRTKSGKPAPGPWATAARSARKIMRWVDECPEWTPPPTGATPK